jgi:hypothetical protein
MQVRTSPPYVLRPNEQPLTMLSFAALDGRQALVLLASDGRVLGLRTGVAGRECTRSEDQVSLLDRACLQSQNR